MSEISLSSNQRLGIRRWNMAGFEAIRRSPGVAALVDEIAGKVATDCGVGFVASGRQGKTRYRAIVYPDTWKAYWNDRKNNTMPKVASAWGMTLGGKKK